MVTIIGRCVLAFSAEAAALTRRKKWRLRTILASYGDEEKGITQ
jgi:hypothetical protein